MFYLRIDKTLQQKYSTVLCMCVCVWEETAVQGVVNVFVFVFVWTVVFVKATPEVAKISMVNKFKKRY